MKRSYLSVIALLVLVILGVGAEGGDESVEVVGGDQVAVSGSIDDFEYLLEPASLLEFVAEPGIEFFLVDTRTPEEYSDGHISSAIQIDYRDIGENPPTDDKDALIVVYCRSGNRSNAAAKTLAGLGYTHVLDWGGINGWPYEVVTGSNPE